MPEYDIEKEHLATGLRLRTSDQIAYFVVGPRLPVGFEIPRILRSPFLGLVGALPKSVFQILDPIAFHRQLIWQNRPNPIRLGIVFEDYFPRWLPAELETPAFYRVFCWATEDEAAIGALSKIDGKIAIMPINDRVEKALRSAGFHDDKLILDLAGLLDLFSAAMLAETQITTEELLERRKEVDAHVREVHGRAYPTEVLPFRPCVVNHNQFQQIFGQFAPRYWQASTKNDFSKRGQALADAFNLVGGSIAVATDFEHEEKKYRGVFPSAILAAPSLNPQLKRALRRHLDTLPAERKDHAKTLMAVRMAEQNSMTYETEVHIDRALNNAAMQHGVSEVAAYTQYFDAMGYLHGSFYCAPYLRAPYKGISLTNHHAYFSPASFPVNATPASLQRKIFRFSEALAKTLHPELRTVIRDYPGGFVAISDLPIEWLSCDGVPLGFLQDVCRIPETVASSIMAQFSRNSWSDYKVTEKTPQRTLVVCCAPKNDEIAVNFSVLVDVWKQRGVPWRWEICASVEQLVSLVNEFRPEILVFDTHGRFVENTTGTELMIGESEYLNGNDVIQKFPQIPIVMLSTCWGSPLYDCPNTIVQAFFEKGSLAVTSSVLPLNIRKGGVLYTRVLNNLAYACSHGVHPNWASFMSHTIRTSYFDDLQVRVLSSQKLQRKNIKYPEAKAYSEIRVNWQATTMLHSQRASAYHEASTAVSSCFSEEYRSRIKALLDVKDFTPEFMFYSTMGRADLIQFKSWNAERHGLSPYDNTIGQLLKTRTANADIKSQHTL